MSDFLCKLFAYFRKKQKKGNKQIEDVPNGIVVKDDIEYGFLNSSRNVHFVIM